MSRLRKNARIAGVVIASIVCAVSSVITVMVLLQGRVVWKAGDIMILQSSELVRPGTTALVSGLLLLRVFCRRRFTRLFRLLSPRGWVLTALLIAVAWAGLSGRHIVHGDGVEYIVQTQALAFDRTLTINCETRRDYWNQTNPYGVTLKQVRPPAATFGEIRQAGGGFGGLYPDRFGDYRYYHYWIYPVAVAPVYLLFHLIDSSGSLEYFSFRFLNVCLLLVFFFLAFRRNPRWPTLAILGLLLFSPLIPYCDWQHPEIFCLTLVFASFHLATGRKTVYASPLLLGLGASMNLPIMLFFPCHFFIAARSMTHRFRELPATPEVRRICGLDVRRARPAGALIAAYGTGVLVALSSSAYYAYYFLTPNVIAHVGLASLKFASISRATDIFFSPFVGAVFFFPMLLLVIPACFSRKNSVTILAALVSVFAAAWLASATSNLNAGQIGTVRYAVWLIAPLWYCLFLYLPEYFSLTRRGWALNATLGLSVLLILYMGTYELFRKDIRRFGGSWRAQPEVAALLRVLPYNDDAEIVAENIMGEELHRPSQFQTVYMWDLGRDKCLWILSEHAILKKLPVLFQADNPEQMSFKASPRQPVGVTWEGKTARIALPDTPVRMHRHPVLGNYLILRSKGRITRILKNQPFHIRSDTVEQVDSFE